MRMRSLMLIACLPFLFSLSQAEQNLNSDWPHVYGFSSDDSNTSSYLGVDIADITADRMSTLKLKEERGVEVTMVDQDAPAGKAGIKEHDVILSMNGTRVEGKAQLQRMIHETPPGRVITLDLSRDGQPLTIKVQLADRRAEFRMYKDGDWGKDFHVEVPPIPNIQIPEMPNIGVVYVHSSMRTGLMIENLTPQLGEFFGTKNGTGVLVRSVDKGSRGEKAGLRAGDVIIRVGDQFIHDTSDFTHALRSQSGASVNVALIRDKKEMTLTLTLPERRDSGELIEENLENSDIEAAANRLALSEVQDELAELQPDMSLEKEELDRLREEEAKASAEMSKALCAEQKSMKLQSKKMNEELRKQIEKSREKAEEEMKQLRRQLRADGFDI